MFSSYSLRQVATSTLMSLVNQAGGIKGLLDNFQPFNSKATIDGITRWYIGTYLPTLLVQEDKISMAHGIEGRIPICYEPLIKFSLSLPGSIKLYKGKLKAVPKRALNSILPSILYSLPKRGFPTPIVSWLSGKLGYEWEMQWKNPLPSCLDGLLDEKGIRKEFLKFRKWGCKMPNAYALAHRLISLQMLLGCARGLQSISSVNA
jgi:asparagine synthase (glutamine-hydrolysing)